MPNVPPKKPRLSANLAEQLRDGAPPRRPALSRELVEALLPPAPAQPAAPPPAPIVIHLGAGAVLNINLAGLAGPKEE
jgi:hypothetical protein